MTGSSPPRRSAYKGLAYNPSASSRSFGGHSRSASTSSTVPSSTELLRASSVRSTASSSRATRTSELGSLKMAPTPGSTAYFASSHSPTPPMSGRSTPTEGHRTTTFTLVTNEDVQERLMEQRRQAEVQEQRQRAEQEAHMRSERRRPPAQGRRLQTHVRTASSSSRQLSPMPATQLPEATSSRSSRSPSERSPPVRESDSSGARAASADAPAGGRRAKPDLVVIEELAPVSKTSPTPSSDSSTPARAPSPTPPAQLQAVQSTTRRWGGQRNEVAPAMTATTAAFYLASNSYRAPALEGGTPESWRDSTPFEKKNVPADRSWYAHLGLTYDLKTVPMRRLVSFEGSSASDTEDEEPESKKSRGPGAQDAAATPRMRSLAKLRDERKSSVATITNLTPMIARGSVSSSNSRRPSADNRGPRRRSSGQVAPLPAASRQDDRSGEIPVMFVPGRRASEPDLSHSDSLPGEQGWSESSDAETDEEEEEEEARVDETPKARTRRLPSVDGSPSSANNPCRPAALQVPQSGNALGLLGPGPLSPLSSFPAPPTARPVFQRSASAKESVLKAVATIKTKLSSPKSPIFKDLSPTTPVPASSDQQQRRAGIRSMPPLAHRSRSFPAGFAPQLSEGATEVAMKPSPAVVRRPSGPSAQPSDTEMDTKRKRSATVLNASSATRTACCGRLVTGFPGATAFGSQEQRGCAFCSDEAMHFAAPAGSFVDALQSAPADGAQSDASSKDEQELLASEDSFSSFGHSTYASARKDSMEFLDETSYERRISFPESRDQQTPELSSAIAWMQSQEELHRASGDHLGSASPELRSIASTPSLRDSLSTRSQPTSVATSLMTDRMQRAVGARREAPFHLPVTDSLPSPKLGAANAFAVQRKRLSRRPSGRLLRFDGSGSFTQDSEGALGFSPGGGETASLRSSSPFRPDDAPGLHRARSLNQNTRLGSLARVRDGASSPRSDGHLSPSITPRSRLSDLPTPPLSPNSPGMRRFLTLEAAGSKSDSALSAHPSPDSADFVKTPPVSPGHDAKSMPGSLPADEQYLSVPY